MREANKPAEKATTAKATGAKVSFTEQGVKNHQVKFQKHYVTDGQVKARVFYSLDNRVDGRKCVTIYAKDYGHDLVRIFADGEYENRTDPMTDYFDHGTVRLFESHPLYTIARERAEQVLGRQLSD